MMKAPRTLSDTAAFWAPAVFVVLWASGFIGAKLGMAYTEPLTFLTIRMFAVVALIGVIAIVTLPHWPSVAGIMHSVAAGALVHGLYLGGVFVSIDHGMPAGLIALVVGLQPLLTSTLASRLLGESVTLRQWFGLILGLLGVYLVVHGRTEGDGSLFAWISATIGLLGITIGTVYQKRFGGGIDWRTGMVIQYASAGALFAIGALLFETRSVQWTGEFVFALAWLVLVLSFGAVWLLYFLIRRSAATRVASMFYLTPPLTALMAWFLYDERLAPLAILGMVICAAGVALVNWRAG